MSVALALLGLLGLVASIAAGFDRGPEERGGEERGVLHSMAGPGRAKASPGRSMPTLGDPVGGIVLGINLERPHNESGITRAALAVGRSADSINRRAPGSEVPLIAFVRNSGGEGQ